MSDLSIIYEEELPNGAWKVVKRVHLQVPDQSILHAAEWVDWLVEGHEP